MINLANGYTSTEISPKFSTGDIINHQMYNYRGVIVDYDSTCQAPEHWYKSNQTRPERHQPWYHVLVDGNQQVTYVAESNLSLDQTGLPIVHGMLNIFFSGYDEQKNKYKRNNVPWNPGNPPEAPPPSPPPDFTPPPPPIL
ncbi:MAG: heat shock protein HspQ [Opitutales bacterium]|nr:heat shock protein HspQ [Opitutales bacterium]